MWHGGYWGSVCDYSTNDFTAPMVCRELGYYNAVRCEETWSFHLSLVPTHHKLDIGSGNI